MIAVLCKDNNVWVPFRPKQRPGKTRSSVDVAQLLFDDHAGYWLHGLLWIAPVQLTTNYRSYVDLHELRKDLAEQYVLVLPRLSQDGSHFENFFYCCGHEHLERVSSGAFVQSQLEGCTVDGSIFLDWRQQEAPSVLQEEGVPEEQEQVASI